MLYGYHIPLKSGIKFDDLDKINNIQKDYKPINNVKNNNSIYSNLQSLSHMTREHGPISTNYSIPNNQLNQINTKNNNKIFEDSLNDYTGKVIISLTEAVNYNIYSWASITYSTEGSIKKMINSGYHSEKVWKSVLFQLMAALYVMQINNIYIDNFSLKTNVFIKDLSVNGNVTNYWKYIVDGCEFYIPNHGYMTIIDSNYKDLSQSETNKFLPKTDSNKADYTNFQSLSINSDLNLSIDVSKIINKENHKLQGEIFNDKSDNKDKIFDIFRNVFNRNCFNQDFLDQGGCKLPDEIFIILTTIQSEAINDRDKNIGKYFKYFGCFVNNRIGDVLKLSEKENIRTSNTFKKGQIIAFTDSFNSLKFGIYKEKISNSMNNIIYIKDGNSKLEEKTVPDGNINNYLQPETIEQKYKPNESNLNEEDLIETYSINQKLNYNYYFFFRIIIIFFININNIYNAKFIINK